MKSHKLVSTIVKGIHAVTRGFTWVATVAMFAIIMVIVINVGGRFFFRQPLQGTIELVEILMVLTAYSVLAYTELRRGHIHIELVISRFSRRAQAIVTSIICFLGAIFFLVMSWQSGELMWSNLFPVINVTDNFSIPAALYIAVMAFGFLMLGLETLINAFHPLPAGEAEQR